LWKDQTKGQLKCGFFDVFLSHSLIGSFSMQNYQVLVLFIYKTD